jgi:hypothetical protein
MRHGLALAARLAVVAGCVAGRPVADAARLLRAGEDRIVSPEPRP